MLFRIKLEPLEGSYKNKVLYYSDNVFGMYTEDKNEAKKFKRKCNASRIVNFYFGREHPTVLISIEEIK